MTDLTMDSITKDCPIECLALMLSTATFTALAAGLEGSHATVGQVVELYEQGQLKKIYNLSSGRVGEIRRCLVAARLMEPGGESLIKRRGVRQSSVQGEHGGACGRHE